MPDIASEHITCSRLRPALGTFVSVHCVAHSDADAERAIATAFEAFAAVHRLMHPMSGQDLVALRSTKIGRTVRIHPWTWEVLALSAEVNDASEGRFDPCLPECDGGMSDIELPEPDVVILHERVALDLGGIAKGFAVDRAIERLMSAGCIGGQVNAGGDMRVFGADNTPVWLRTDHIVRLIALRDRACALSDPLVRDKPPEHRGYYSRVTPFESGDLRAAAVVASTTATADALTKCVLLCRHDPALLKRVLSQFDAAAIDMATGTNAPRPLADAERR
jgi:thiamine biosynthesis lipoprotein